MASCTESSEVTATFRPKNEQNEPWTGTLRQTITTELIDASGEQIEAPKTVIWDRPSPELSFREPIPVADGELHIEGHEGAVEVVWSNGRFNHISGFRQ